ncbi:unnamed protein product [Notodromas monacha]|uniref:GMP phosphodiesterase delta subunit domain-containing protein n=1 Tax=Notodromas monacha TaxID=399045 RepID=A0A7R9GAT6_9CRUS|nr:unnamed protein product [Notodromas monacha]CAG0915794.1 unnamed protein product [Notodromas monacha]
MSGYGVVIDGMTATKKGNNDSNASKESVTEDELLVKGSVTPNDVLRLGKVTAKYLCGMDANTYGVDFTRFKIRCMDTGVVLFEISKPSSDYAVPAINVDDDLERGASQDRECTAGRYVRYQFTPEFLKFRRIGATVEFAVGDKPVNNFRMIERHFFRDRLLKTFDFDFGFCIPNSRNSCEHIYEMPELDKNLMQEMIASPFETRSDSFYFVGNELIMHNKADYAYNGGANIAGPKHALD